MFGILITSLSKKWPLVEAVKKASARLTDLAAIHGADSHKECVAKWKVDHFWHMPPLREITPQQILDYCQQQSIKAIIPTRNEDVAFFSQNINMFKQAGIGIMVSSDRAVQCCLDKVQFHNELIQANLPVIPTHLSLEKIDCFAYVVKERFGAGSQGVGLNLSKMEAVQCANSLKAPIFQPFMRGQEWSLDIYRSLQGQVMGVVARQRNYVEKGESQVTTTQSYPALEALGSKVANTLNLYGHSVVQVIEDETRNFHIVECNPRFGGASTASLAVGLDSFYWFFLECLHQNIENYPFIRSQSEIRQVRHPADWIMLC